MVTARDIIATYYMTDPPRAFELSSAMLDRLQSHENLFGEMSRAIVWRTRAEACIYTGRLKDARESYQSAICAAEHAGAPGLLGQILVGFIHVLAVLGEQAESSGLAVKAERLLKKAGDTTYLGKLYLNSGNAAYQEEKYQEAYNAYKKAARIMKAAGGQRVAEGQKAAGGQSVAWVCLMMNQAIVCTNLSKIREAHRLFLEGQNQCDRDGLEALGAHIRFNRAFLERLGGDYRTALTLLEEAGAVFERQETLDMVAATKRSRAEIYLELGMAPEALSQASDAAEMFAREGMELDSNLARIDEASGLLNVGNPTDAAGLLESALKYFHERGIRPRRALVQLQLATVLIDTGSRVGFDKEASSLARKALKTFESLEMWRAVSEARRLLAGLALKRGRVADAEHVLAPAVKRVHRLSLGEQIPVWALAGKISRAKGSRRDASRNLRRAVKLLEAQRTLIPGIELRSRAFDTQVEVYHDLISLTLEAKSPRFGSLFNFVEASRARGFRERTKQKAPAARKLTEKRVLLGSLIRRSEEIELSGASPERNELRRSLYEQVHLLEQEILSESRRKDTGRPGDGGWGGVVSPDRIAELLDKDEILIEYLVLGNQVLLLLLGRNLRVIRRLQADAVMIQSSLEKIRLQVDMMALSAGSSTVNPAYLKKSTDAVLIELYEMILAPVMEFLEGAARLTIIPHRFLHHLPFEALHDGREYINRRFLISRSPTADFLERRRRSAKYKTQSVLVSGTTVSGPTFVAPEIKMVSSFFPKPNVKLLHNPSTSTLLAEMAHHNIIHLSSHGTFRDDNPLFSGLSTSDGALFLIDISGLQLNADLVVLSACNSGRVFAGCGDDLSGVAHGFLAAGASRLVAGIWRVHDESTHALMKTFYNNYSKDPRRDVAAALAGAAREVYETWPHPFYWGGFAVYGI